MVLLVNLDCLDKRVILDSLDFKDHLVSLGFLDLHQKKIKADQDHLDLMDCLDFLVQRATVVYLVDLAIVVHLDYLVFLG